MITDLEVITSIPTPEAKRSKLRTTSIDPVSRKFTMEFIAENKIIEGNLNAIPADSAEFLLWYGTKQYLADNGKDYNGTVAVMESIMANELNLVKARKAGNGLEAKLLKAASSGSIAMDMEALKKLLALAKTL